MTERETFEPERYELREAPAYSFEQNRREFVVTLGAGLLVTCVAPAAEGGAPRARIHAGDDGIITVFTGKVEMGQGSRTEVAMAAAEELRLPLDRIRVVMADTDIVPDDGITAGSRTTPGTIPHVRKAAAALRDYRVAKNPPPDDVKLTPVSEWRVLGTSHHHTNARQIVTGGHRYPSDIVRPGMVYGAVLRAPAYGVTLAKVDLAAAEKMSGVTAVRDGAFVGCTAKTSFAARKAVDAIAANAQWDTKPHPSSDQLFTWLKEHSGARPPRVTGRGAVEKGLAAAHKRHRAEYHVPFIQHAPMEPRAAVAEWANGKLTVWTGTQNPFGVRDQLMQAFHLPEEKVRVIVPDTGGGWGGKHTGECAIEGARLARETGKPVSLRWTRHDEFMWAYFRPAGLFEIEAGLDERGRLTAWDFTNYNAGTAAIESPYVSPNVRTKFVYCESPLREGSYRGIAATANNFARECFIDELAGVAGMDPLEFRLVNLDQPRLRAVLEEVTKDFGWAERRRQKRPGIGVGLACGTEKGSFVAACVEIEVDAKSGSVKVRDYRTAFECGAILNESNLRAQAEGCIIQGLGGALTEEIEFANGRLKNGSFAKYRVPRFRDVPPIKLLLLNRRDLPPAGAGETPIIAVAPAISAALSHMSGKPNRAMPVRFRA